MSSQLFFKRLFIIIYCFILISSSAFAWTAAAEEFNRKGVVATNAGYYKDAINYLKKAMSLEPNWGEPCFNASKLMNALKKNLQAFDLLKKAYYLEPDVPKYKSAYIAVLKSRLKYFEANNETSDATNIKEEIIKIDPSELVIGVELLKKYSTEDRDKALLFADNLIKSNVHLKSDRSSVEMGFINLYAAKYYNDLKDLDKALYYASEACKYPGADEAKKIVESVKSIKKNRMENFIRKAEEAKNLGEHSTASEYLKLAAEVQPQNDQISELLIEVEHDKKLTAAVRKAKVYSEKGFWIQVMKALREVESLIPSGSKAEKMLRRAEKINSETAKAIGTGNQLSEDDSSRKNIVLHYLDRGNRCLKADKIVEAKEFFTNLLKLIAIDETLISFRGVINEKLAVISRMEQNDSNWKKAVESRNAGEYEEALNLFKTLPKDYDIQLFSYLAECYFKTEDYDRAYEFAKKQLDKQPENNRAKFVLGDYYLIKDNKATANKLFREIKAADEGYPGINDKILVSSTSYFIQYGLIIVLILAIIFFKWLVKKMPDFKRNDLLKKAASDLKKGYFKECINDISQVRKMENLTPEQDIGLARISAQANLKNGSFDKVIAEAKRLLSINRVDEEAHTWLGYAFLGKRVLTPESLPELLFLFRKEKRNIALVSLLGSHYARQNNISKEGIEVLEQWLLLEENNPELLIPLGRYYLKKSRSDGKAMMVFNKMLEIMTANNSFDADFMLGIAKLHIQNKAYDVALNICEQVINLDVNNELVHEVLLDIYTTQGNLDELVSVYRSFLKENPYNVAFQNGLMAVTKRIEDIQRNDVKKENTAKRQYMNQMRLEAARLRRQSAEESQEEAQEDTIPAEGSGDGISESEQVEPTEDQVEPTEEQVESTEDQFEDQNVSGIVCPKCQTSNPEGSYVCSNCGANLF